MQTTTRVLTIATCLLLLVSNHVIAADSCGASPEVCEWSSWHLFIDTLALRPQEATDPGQARAHYQELLQARPPLSPINIHRAALHDFLRTIEESSVRVPITFDAAFGHPRIYAREVLGRIQAYEGVARTHVTQGSMLEAEQSVKALVEFLTRYGQVFPALSPVKLRDAHQLLEEVYRKQGRTGRALIAKLNVDLLNDHLSSEGGVEDFYLEKEYLYGQEATKQITAIEKYIEAHRKQISAKEAAQTKALMSSFMTAYATVQQVQAALALADSGGVLTPGVQQAMMNAQVAQLAASITQSAIAASANAQKSFDVASTPWALPTFSQQLLDPRAGVNPQGVIKDFTGEVVKAGGASYQAGAQQLTQQVDALMPYRQSSKVDGAAAQVEKFAEVFNAFLSQVQEIRN